MRYRRCVIWARASVVAAVAVGLSATPARAQRADANVVTEAEDAFGLTLSGQSVGLYNSRNIRNSDPVQLGNLRLDGLYIDRQGSFTTQLIGATAIRVGSTIIELPFPAPGGIVDFRTRPVPTADELALTTGLGRYLSPYVELDVGRWLVPGRLAVIGGASLYPQDNVLGGGFNRYGTVSLDLVFRQSSDLTLSVFGNRIWDWRIQSPPVFYFQGTALPAAVPRDVAIAQPWAHGHGTGSNAGARIDWLPRGAWAARAGVFVSERVLDENYDAIFTDLDDLGRGNQLVSASRGRVARSLSGEGQARYGWAFGRVKNAIDASVRGRYVVRRFGSAELLDLGAADLHEARPVSQPALADDRPGSRDSIAQGVAGLRYRAKVDGWGYLSAGLQGSTYHKRFDSQMDTSTRQRSNDLLTHATLAVPLGPTRVYVSHAEGLQEGGVAPADAGNRYQVLAMIKSRQLEAGVRYLIASTQLDVAAFTEQKPYAGVDADSIYRLLGEVHNRGVEVSLSSLPVPGLKVVAGLLLLQPRLTIDDAAEDDERRAVGVPTRRAQLNADYKMSWLHGLSIDGRVDYSAGTAMSIERSTRLPAETTLDLGLRVPLKLEAARFMLRLQVTNVLDQFAWRVDSFGGFTYSPPRTFTLVVTSNL
jgi:iron complex outermembrane recepter protein